MADLTFLEMMQMTLAGQPLPPGVHLPVQMPPAINRLLGITLIEVAAGKTVMTLQTVMAQHANPMGTLHGGVLCDLGDAAIGSAHFTTLAPGESFTSLDLRINFFRPVWEDMLTATAQARHLGRTVSYYECTIVNSQGKTVAIVTSSVMTLRGDAAKGR